MYCSCLVCIVVVVLCILLVVLCVLLLVVLCVKSVFERSCDRPPRHRFFLVSLCLKANVEMVPNNPSCHYMLLM